MTMPAPDPGKRPDSSRMSRTVKVVLMGAGAAALLYSCAPGIGSGLGALPYLWFFTNPFYRGPVATAPQTPGTTTTSPGTTRTSPGTTTTQPGTTTPQTQSQRGGFGGSAGQHGTTGS